MQELKHFLMSWLSEGEKKFDYLMQSINFSVFCIVYSIIFFYIMRRCRTYDYYRPKNRQILTRKQEYKSFYMGLLKKIPFVTWYMNKKLNAQLKKLKEDLLKSFRQKRDERTATRLPKEGMSEQKIKRRIEEWSKKQNKLWTTGKISGSFYTTDEQHFKQVTDFAAIYMYQNPLHLDAFRQLSKMQSEILQMTSSMLSVNKVYGTITSGGTESLMLALYAYRNYYSNRTKPNIVIPVTAHVAIDKGCFYFNIEARKAKLNSLYEVDLAHMQSLIDSNTIMLLGSAPNYPHGIIDPIEKIAKLALKYKTGMHIDGCLGGFVIGFSKQLQKCISLDITGVTSVSLDQHKFGLAPKGVSTIFYKTPELRHSQYYSTTQWKGGIYITSGMSGSRSGFASAGAWYSLTHVTKRVFNQNSRQIRNATTELAKNLRKIPGVEVFGNPQTCVVAFAISQRTVRLYDLLTRQYKWQLSLLHRPIAIHISITLANCEKAALNLANHVQKCLEILKESKGQKQSTEAALYGATAKMPENSMTEETLKCVIGSTLL